MLSLSLLLRNKGVLLLSIGNFLVRFHNYLILFTVSTFLASFMDERAVGVVLAAIATLVGLNLLRMPALFARFGPKRLLVILGILEAATVMGLSVVQTGILPVILLVFQGVFASSIFLGLDLLLECQTTSEKKTGHLRGMFLVFANTAVLAASIALGSVMNDHNYEDLFFLAAVSLVPFVLLSTAFPAVSHAVSRTETSLREAVMRIQTRADLFPTILAHFLLLLFFSWSFLYLPLYLHEHVGFSWKSVGYLLALTLSPYVVLEYIVGSVADSRLGERKIVIAGFTLMILAMGSFAFIGSAGLLWWALAFLVGGVGGALAEVATEAHFFRLVSVLDGEVISVFRMLRPLSVVVGPLMASFALLFLPFSGIFIFFALILILGIPVSLRLVDFSPVGEPQK